MYENKNGFNTSDGAGEADVVAAGDVDHPAGVEEPGRLLVRLPARVLHPLL